MRILGFWIKSLLTILVVVVISGLLAREALLIFGVAQLRTSVSTLRNISRNSNQYSRQCLQKGSVVDGQVIDQIQLRFVSNQDYVVEVVCSGFTLDPILVKAEQLPMFVTKKPGSGGIIWGDQPSGIILDVFGRSRAVLVEQQEVFYENDSEEVNLGVSPRTSCVGYGYECCAAESTLGVGELQPAVTDCPRTCYSSCQQIPVVLSFTSDPFMDPATRTSTIQKGQQVTFSYVTDSLTDPTPTVLVDFGDGTTQTVNQASGLVTHQYSCAGSSCQFDASLTVTTLDGLSSKPLPVSKITIVVR